MKLRPHVVAWKFETAVVEPKAPNLSLKRTHLRRSAYLQR